MDAQTFNTIVTNKGNDKIAGLEKDIVVARKCHEEVLEILNILDPEMLPNLDSIYIGSFYVEFHYPADKEIMKDVIALAASNDSLERSGETKFSRYEAEAQYYIEDRENREIERIDLQFGSQVKGSTCKFVETGETKEFTITNQVYKMECE